MAATITITIRTSNAAFYGDDGDQDAEGMGPAAGVEIGRILRKVVTRTFNGCDLAIGDYSLFDANGNHCGLVEIAQGAD